MDASPLRLASRLSGLAVGLAAVFGLVGRRGKGVPVGCEQLRNECSEYVGTAGAVRTSDHDVRRDLQTRARDRLRHLDARQVQLAYSFYLFVISLRGCRADRQNLLAFRLALDLHRSRAAFCLYDRFLLRLVCYLHADLRGHQLYLLVRLRPRVLSRDSLLL